MFKKLIPVVALIVCAMIACSKSEKSESGPAPDPTGTGPGNGNGNGNGNGSGNTPYGSIAGDTIALTIKGDSSYFPYVAGMKLSYRLTEIWSPSKTKDFQMQRVADLVTDTARYVIIKDNFEGKDSLFYYQFKQGIYLQFANADSKPKTDAMIWKWLDDKSDSWIEEKVVNGTTYIQTRKITGRKEMVTVGKKVFLNVLRVEVEQRHQTTDGSGGVRKYASFYAPGIGLIQEAGVNDTIKLMEITLPK